MTQYINGYGIEGGLSNLEIKVLSDLAAESGAERALEVGHWYGLSTAVLLKHLPPECEFITVDHHDGDRWIPASKSTEFEANVKHYIGKRPYTFLDMDMLDACKHIGDGIDFVFYDADHERAGFEHWWDVVKHHLAPACTLIYDDADWRDQGLLKEFAAQDGFRVVTELILRRDKERDKAHPDTYTLEVMRRESL